VPGELLSLGWCGEGGGGCSVRARRFVRARHMTGRARVASFLGGGVGGLRMGVSHDGQGWGSALPREAVLGVS
jgi:hypothetical protein